LELPGPSGAFSNEIIAGSNKLGDTENTLFFEGGNGSGAGDPFDGAFESFVKLLRQNHLFLPLWILGKLRKRLKEEQRFWRLPLPQHVPFVNNSSNNIILVKIIYNITNYSYH